MRRFNLAADDLEQLLAGLVARGRLEREPVRTIRRTLYDTFDWRLYKQPSVLEHQVLDEGVDGTLVWRSLDTGEQLGRVDVEMVPRFTWHLPHGPVAERLGGVIEMRALLPLVSVTSRRTTLRLLDAEDKTVGRVVVDEGSLVGGRTLEPVVEIIPVRGYEAEAEELVELLDAQLILRGGADDLMIAALRTAGYAPGSYSSKLKLQLDSASVARDAWVTVLRALFATMVANEAGLRDDLDSEFLHDFRVAVRRTRSVLGQAKGVLPAAALDHFRDEFAWLGQVTGPTRDFDVFLLTMPSFRARMPEQRRADLKPFEGFVEQRQHAAHAALVAELDTPRYAQLLADWSAFLDDVDAQRGGPRGDEPAGVVAAERIRRAHRGVIRDGRAVHETSDPEALHDLRKDAKKLRYLLECFGSMFPPDDVIPIVADLKGLQDVLGEYQDCQVQADSLEHLGEEMLERDGAPASALLAMGSLVEQLSEREHDAVAQFAQRFSAFDRKQVRRAVKQLGRDAA